MLTNSELKEVMDLDKSVYDKIYVTNVNDILGRYRANSKSFIVVYDENGSIVGYMNLYPVTNELYNTIKEVQLETDIHIKGDDILPYKKGESYKLYIMSVVVSPKYQGSNVAKLLSKGFKEYLSMLSIKGIKIDNILAMAVSNSGVGFAKKLGLKKKGSKDGNVILELY